MLRRITFGCLAFRCRPCVSDGEERIATAPNLWVFWAVRRQFWAVRRQSYAAQRGHPRTPTNVEDDTGVTWSQVQILSAQQHRHRVFEEAAEDFEEGAR